MVAAIRAEFRKLFTLRSTYVFIGLAVAFTLFYAGFIEGYKLTNAELLNKHLFEQDVVGALGSLPMIFGVLISILLMTHEYRYNTIMHTLTASNSRFKVLAAKFAAVTVFGILFTVLIGVLSPLSSFVGIQLHGHTLIAQELPVASLIWRGLLNGWGFFVFSLGLAVLIRNQIGAIISIFVIPTFESVLGLLIKDNVKYLPFTSMNGILGQSVPSGVSHVQSAAIFGCWIVGTWLVATVLFLKRDAN